MIHGFDHTLGYNPLRIAEVSDATGARDYIAGPEQRVFSPLFPSYRSLLADMLGLRYIVSSVPIGEGRPRLKPGDLRFLARTRDGYVYENPRALPRVLFATNWLAADFDWLIETGNWPDFDPRRTVLLEAEAGVDAAAAAQRRPSARARSRGSTHYENTVVEIDADSVCGGYVVLNDVWQPWWTVTVDGKPADILQANVLFRAVEVTPGRHRCASSSSRSKARSRSSASACSAKKPRPLKSGAASASSASFDFAPGEVVRLRRIGRR